MLPTFLVLLVLLPAALLVAAQNAADLQVFASAGSRGGFEPPDPCLIVSPPCMSWADRYSLEALKSIHQMMDDDHDGGIEVEESMEFIIEDMKQQQTHKHSKLHREDQHITVEELWRGWKSSEVHNWTQEDVLRWLREFVELPQYERNFKDFKVNGNTLPRIAANEPSFLSGQLKVQDQRDKQKLSIKALDVVLFGPPTRPPHNYMKDLLLIVSVVMGVGGCWFAQAQNKASKVHIAKMMKDLESLQRAEQSLMDLQEQLERTQEEKRSVAEQKQYLEEKMRDEIMGAQEEAHRLHELRQGAVTELSRLRYAEEELEQVRGALKQAEKEVLASWTFSEVLQQWLQLTHEVEVQYYNVKKKSAELQLAAAKEEAERIKKKRSSVLGTLHVAHSSSLDHVDSKIMEAKQALSEVTACLRERLHRWQQIELLCGFPIMRNPGLAALTSQLYADSTAMGLSRVPQSSCSCHSSSHGSIEDLLDEPAAPILPQMSVPLPPMKCSPRLRASTLYRTPRSGIVSQPPPAVISPDPDLLIPIRSPHSCYDEEEKLILKVLKKQDSKEKFLDSEYIAPLSKMFPSSTLDSSSRRFYHDDAELLGDSFVTKYLGEHKEEAAESSVHRFSEQEQDTHGDTSVAERKMAKDKLWSFDPSLGTSSLKLSGEESIKDTIPKKITRQKSETSMDLAFRKGISNEFNVEVSPTKIDKDIAEDVLDNHSRNLYKETCDLPLDMRKVLQTESEASTDARRKIPKEMIGQSMDGISKMARDDSESLLESRRITRNAMGMSQDTASRMLFSPGECPFDISAMASPKDKTVDAGRMLRRKTSEDELESYLNSTSTNLLLRETTGAMMDSSSSKDSSDFGSEPSISGRLLKNESEQSAGSLRRRIPRMPRNDSYSTETSSGNPSWNRMDVLVEGSQNLMSRDEVSTSTPRSLPCHTGEPDLTPTSRASWKSSSDLSTGGPLSQLVYDGILEKSRAAVTSPPMTISASTPNLPQSRLQAEADFPLPPLKGVHPSLAPPAEGGDDKNRDKDKSKKTLKLKNLFKKKNESTPEKPQSGLQKL